MEEKELIQFLRDHPDHFETVLKLIIELLAHASCLESTAETTPE